MRKPGELPPASSDGRAARSERTRRAVIEALLALIREGNLKPGAREVAERAGVSTRTVFAHFASLEDLHRATVERVTALVLSLLSPISPSQSLAARVEAICAQRARVNEEMGPIHRAAALQEPFSAALQTARGFGRRASREQIDRVFARELARLDSSVRRRRRAALDAMLSGETWDLLRGVHGLSFDAAQLAVRDAVGTMLSAGTRSAAKAAATSSEVEEREDHPRAEAARRSLVDVEERIQRLVAALEAGSPVDVLAPRLEALRTARLAAERDLAEARSGRPA